MPVILFDFCLLLVNWGKVGFTEYGSIRRDWVKGYLKSNNYFKTIFVLGFLPLRRLFGEVVKMFVMSLR